MVEDRQVDPAIKLMLDPFSLRVTGFSTAPGTTIGIVTETKIDKTAAFNADLKYAMDDGRLEGTAQLAGFDMTVIQPYLDRYTRMDLLEGLLTADLALTLLADGGFAANGMIQVDKLRTVDKAGRKTSSSGRGCGPRASATTAARRSCASSGSPCARRTRA